MVAGLFLIRQYGVPDTYCAPTNIYLVESAARKEYTTGLKLDVDIVLNLTQKKEFREDLTLL